MVVDTHRSDFECAFPEWKALLAACEEYATLRGWRFVLDDFIYSSIVSHAIEEG